MTQIKSEKAKDYIMSIVEPVPAPEGELVFYVEMTPLQVVEAIVIAETEAEERHAKESQELTAERDKYKALYENCQSAIQTPQVATKQLQELKDKPIKAFCDCCDRYETIVCCEQDNCSYLKQFTQKLNEDHVADASKTIETPPQEQTL